jgi:phosphoribosyl 1,2-cyclic phosphodiesterase
MKLHVINSNSSGNSYLLQSNDGNTLIIELGVNFDQIKKALNFKLINVCGALVTHSHRDHCRSVREAIKMGINIYGTQAEFNAMDLIDFILRRRGGTHHRINFIKEKKPFNVGPFKILAFSIEHDTPEPVGYLINHEECGNLLFLTDTYYCKYKFQNLNNIIIECNYSDEIINENLASGILNSFLRDRIYESHLSLKNCKGILSATDLKDVENIVLIHLSASNSDSELFKDEIIKHTGKIVNVAYPGLIIENFNKPFYL